MTWNIFNILMFYGCIQGLVLSVIVLSKKGERKAGTYLALVLFGFSMNLLYYFLSDVGFFKLYPFLKLFYLPWAMLTAISFYLYVTFSAPFQNKLTALNKLGFLPFFLFGFLILLIRFTEYFMGRNYLLSDSSLSFFYLFEEFFGIFYSLILGVMSYRKIIQIDNKLKEQISNFNEAKLKFHKRLLILGLMYCVAWFVLYTIAISFNIDGLYIYYLLWLFLAGVIHWVAWSGFINDSDLVLGIVRPQIIENAAKDDTQIKTETNDKHNLYYQKLISLLEEDKVYLDENLSLTSLSKKIGISNSYLSLIINQKANSNFYYFINSYRVNHVIDLLKKPENSKFTILSLAFQSGFNSKSTFQSSFKKHTDKTPTQYMKDLKDKSEYI